MRRVRATKEEEWYVLFANSIQGSATARECTTDGSIPSPNSNKVKRQSLPPTPLRFALTCTGVQRLGHGHPTAPDRSSTAAFHFPLGASDPQARAGFGTIQRPRSSLPRIMFSARATVSASVLFFAVFLPVLSWKLCSTAAVHCASIAPESSWRHLASWLTVEQLQ